MRIPEFESYVASQSVAFLRPTSGLQPTISAL
jgi:hypothetical protein